MEEIFATMQSNLEIGSAALIERLREISIATDGQHLEMFRRAELLCTMNRELNTMLLTEHAVRQSFALLSAHIAIARTQWRS